MLHPTLVMWQKKECRRFLTLNFLDFRIRAECIILRNLRVGVKVGKRQQVSEILLRNVGLESENTANKENSEYTLASTRASTRKGTRVAPAARQI